MLNRALTAGLLLLFTGQSAAEVVPAKYFADGMIIQRGEPVTVWGVADPGEPVEVRFLGDLWDTRADGSGHWELELPAQSSGRGLQMTVGRHTISNIAFGDVWLASGQSNMEFRLKNAGSRFPEELQLESYPDIRQFLVANDFSFDGPRKEFLAANWQRASGNTVGRFSAVAWFFAKELAATQDVPIGIINSSVGATPVESWMSYRSLDAFPAAQSIAEEFSRDGVVAAFTRKVEERTAIWEDEARRRDLGLVDDIPWSSVDLRDAGWDSFSVPGTPGSEAKKFGSGVVWLRREIVLTPSQAAASNASLQLGLLVDIDETYVNGHKIGSTPTRYRPRNYEVPAGVLRPGRNVIAIRLQVIRGNGGAVKDEDYALTVGRDVVDLKGNWKWKIGARMPPLGRPERLETRPTGLYNAMIAPAHKIRIKGFIWYQGESNTARPDEYAALFSSMITDWRKRWQQGDLPFLYVQLANFMKPSEMPAESTWAELRQAQTEVETMLPNTAMALAIDVGEWNNIHPLDKKTVGQRLALAARALAYGESDLAFRSPKATAVTRDRNTLVVGFERIGEGLAVHGEALRGFAVAGQDGIFVWANARLENDRVVVWNDTVSEPVRVRYAWAQNPANANLYSAVGLPAVPFSLEVGD